jgi:hypothetical protein
MKPVLSVFWLFLLFSSACGPSATPFKSENSIPTWTKSQELIFGGNVDLNHPQQESLDLRLTATLVHQDGEPAAGVAFQFKQSTFLGYFFPTLSFLTSRGLSSESGQISQSIHPQCSMVELSYQLEGEPWRILDQGGYSPEQSDWGEVVIPKLSTLSGKIAPIPSKGIVPAQAWVWETARKVRFHLLPILADDLLIHGDDLDWLIPAESVAAARNASDLRRTEFTGIELKLNQDFEFTYTGRVDDPAICVLDNLGRYHWFKGKALLKSGEGLKLSALSTRSITVIDEHGNSAVDAFIASATHGDFQDHEIMSEVGLYPQSEKMEIPAHEDGFHTVAGRWQKNDPWYTWDWFERDEEYDDPNTPFILPRAKPVTVTVGDINGRPITNGSITIVSSNFVCDPDAASFQEEAALNSQGKAKFNRVPPMNEPLTLVHSPGISPIPVEMEYDPNSSEWSIVVAPLRKLSISFEGPKFAESFFPVWVDSDLEGAMFPGRRWAQRGQVVMFEQVRGFPLEISFHGADGTWFNVKWDGVEGKIVLTGDEAERW